MSGGFNLGDYVTVAERIDQFYDKYPKGSLQAEVIELSETRVVVRAYAYREADDAKPAIAHSMLGIPGSTQFTRGSEIENAETSAWGRAIGALGILIDRSIASANEIETKRDEAPAARVRPQNHPSAPAAAKVAPPTEDGGLIGTAITQGTADFELRQSPEGWTLPFRVKEGGKSFIVLAHDTLAEALAAIKPTVLNQRVTVWGHWGEVVIPGKTTYQVLHLERIATPDGILPAPAGDTPMPEFPDDLDQPPADLPLFGEQVA